MTNLRCDVTSCMHNADKCCGKNSILVDGYEACDCEDTACASFDKKNEAQFTNSYETPNTGLTVECEAFNCVYNEDRMCRAQRIDIIGGQTSKVDGTACATFKMR